MSERVTGRFFKADFIRNYEFYVNLRDFLLIICEESFFKNVIKIGSDL